MECQDCKYRTYDLRKAIEHFNSTGHSDFEYDNFPLGSIYLIKVSNKSD